MRKVSTKRQTENRQYQKVKQELEKELKLSGEWCCFFSGIPFPDYATWKDVTFHHVNGRENDLLIDKRYLRPVLDKYHTQDEGWHSKPLSHLKSLWWFNGFLERLKKLDINEYEKIIDKL